MIAQEYRIKNNKLMEKWEKEFRKWLRTENENVVATFFKDGIVDPDTWYKNEFKPLFILKETHDNNPENKNIDFVAMKTGNEYDIWNRRGRGMWGALGALAKGLITYQEKHELVAYEALYNEDLNLYQKTLQRIAIINIKKVSSGGKVDSKESMDTKHFSCHAYKFKNELKTQIEIIEPSIVICCGSDVGRCLDFENDKVFGFPAVIGLHPSIQPNLRRNEFYYETISKAIDVYNKSKC